VDHASKVGFAARLPVTTEFYLGTTQLKTHLETLKKSAYWKDMEALVQDKTPAPTAGDKSMAAFQNLWGDDVFMAGGAGFAQNALLLKDLNRLYNEVYFKILMTGSASGLQGGPVGTNPLMYLQSFLNDPTAIGRVADLVGRFELAPLMLGFKTAQPDEVLKLLSNTKVLEEKKIFIMSDLETPGGHKFRVATVDLAVLMPEQAQEKAMSQLPETMPEETRAQIAQAYDALQTKKFKLAWGVVDGHLLLACGMNLDHLTLAATPGESFLTSPELGHLLPYMEKNLTGLMYANAATVAAFNDDQPFVPMLRGVVGAMKENEMFGDLGAVLEKQLVELAPLESAVYSAATRTLAAVGWWDKGFHLEAFGGLEPRFMLPAEPLKFGSLVEKHGVVFGIAYHRNEAYGQDFRAWMEKLTGMLYTGAQELVKAGIAGPQSGQQFAQFEGTFLPTLLELYRADKTMDDLGMGTELAFILDVNGKMPAFPGVPPESKGMMFPRITTIGDVKNREELGKGWASMSKSINALAASMGGGAAQPGVPSLFALPDPISSEKNGVTSYFFGLPFFSGDLLPVASVNDKVLFLSTSKDAAESFAGELAAPAAAPVHGCVWKLDVGALREYLAVASGLSPNRTPEQIQQLKDTLKWMEPFKAMDGHTYEEKGVWRSSLHWEITDVLTFD
jgi:hypothetical protein